MDNALREQMLASATDAVNAVCTFAQDQPLADFAAREECVLNVGRALMATWLGQLAGVAGPRTPACPKCGVHSLNAVRRQRKSRTLNSRCGTVHIPRIRLTCRGCQHSWLPLQSVLGVGAKQRTRGGLQHWEALLGGLTIFAEAAQLLETLARVQVGTETLRTHAEAAGTELEGEQRAAMVAGRGDAGAAAGLCAGDQRPDPGGGGRWRDGALSGSRSGRHVDRRRVA